MNKNNSFENLIKADFYKLSKNKLIVICPIVIAILLLLNYIVMWTATGAFQDAEEPIRLAFSIKSNFFAFSSQALLPLFIAISISLIIGSDFSYGLTKLSIARGANRYEYYFSKFIVMSTLSTIYTVFAFIVSSILCGFSFLVPNVVSGWDVFNGIEFGYVIRCLVLNIFINITATSLFTGITFLCKKQSLALGINLAVYILGSFIITMFLVLGSSEEWITEIVKYTPYELQSLACSFNGYLPEESARMALMPIVYFVIGILIGLIDFVKRDID